MEYPGASTANMLAQAGLSRGPTAKLYLDPLSALYEDPKHPSINLVGIIYP